MGATRLFMPRLQFVPAVYIIKSCSHHLMLAHGAHEKHTALTIITHGQMG